MTEMRRDVPRLALTALVAFALTIAFVVALPASGVVLSDDSGPAANATSGESLATAFATHGSDVQSDLDRRELSAALGRVDGEAATAALLAERRIEAERAAAALAERRERLQSEREAGELSASAHRVERARLTARADRLRRLLAAVANESERLPDGLREAYGLEEPALDRSRTRIAAADPAATEGAATSEADLGSARNGTERAVVEVERQQAAFAALLESLAANDTDAAALECGRSRLAVSTDATERSRSALAAADGAAAEAALVESRTALRGAYGCLAGTVDAGELPDREYEFANGSVEWNASDTDWETWNESEFDDHGTPTYTGTPSKDEHETLTRHETPSRDEYETPTRYRTPTGYGTSSRDEYETSTGYRTPTEYETPSKDE